MIRPLLPLLALALAGCTTLDDAQPSDVLTIACNTEQGSCKEVGIADGTTPITLAVCVPAAVTDRATNLQATLELSTGNSWTNPTSSAAPGSLTLPLSSERCLFPSFTPSTSVGQVRIDATVGSVVVTQFVPLRPAAIGAVEIVPATNEAAANMDDVLTVTVLAQNGGLPSIGTTLTVTAPASSIMPPTCGMVFVSPQSTVLTGSPGMPIVNTATLHATPSAATVTSFVITVIATPPADPGGGAVTDGHSSITISLPPP